MIKKQLKKEIEELQEGFKIQENNLNKLVFDHQLSIGESLVGREYKIDTWNKDGVFFFFVPDWFDCSYRHNKYSFIQQAFIVKEEENLYYFENEDAKVYITGTVISRVGEGNLFQIIEAKYSI